MQRGRVWWRGEAMEGCLCSWLFYWLQAEGSKEHRVGVAVLIERYRVVGITKVWVLPRKRLLKSLKRHVCRRVATKCWVSRGKHGCAFPPGMDGGRRCWRLFGKCCAICARRQTPRPRGARQPSRPKYFVKIRVLATARCRGELRAVSGEYWKGEGEFLV